MKYSRVGLTTITAILFTAVVLVFAGGCSAPNQLDTVRAGKTVAYAPGVPNFDMEGVAARRDQKTGVDVHIGIPHFSFVFEQDSVQFLAPYELSIQVLSEDGESLVTQETWQDTVRAENEGQTEKLTRVALSKHVSVAPGRYVLRTLLRDLNSKKQATRVQQVRVPDLAGTTAQLGPLLMESKEDADSFQPVVTLHIPADMDSLRTTAELYNAGSAQQAEVTTKLVRFRTDDAVADPPYWLTPMSGSLEYRGVDYGEADTIDVDRRSLQNIGLQTSIHYNLPSLEPGIYRVLTTVRLTGVRDTTGTVIRRQMRDLSMKSADFPEVVSLEEVVSALAYIARDRELENIREAESPQTMRRRFDAFWGERTGSKEAAASLLETYYGRVEEANLYFTTHKAGWKTDRGMLYIILGAPIEVDYYVDSEVWYYSYSTQDPTRVYVFERGLHYDRRGMLFDNFVLQRRPYYQEIWQRMVNRWRRGQPMM